MEEVQKQTLIDEALKARSYSYSPYSQYRVGAALLTKSGKIYRGCNIENAAYGPSNCAERTAFFKAVSEGEREFTAIAIVGGRAAAKPSDERNIPADHPTDEQTNEEYETSVSDMAYPCGVCRQVMREFCDPDTFQVIVAKSITEYEVRTLADLLPDSFGPDNLSD